MRNIFIYFTVCFGLFGLYKNANAETIEAYLSQNNLLQAYEQTVKKQEKSSFFTDNIKKTNETIQFVINTSLNKEYKNAFISDYLKDSFRLHNKHEKGFAEKYAVRYDPLGGIKFLESLKDRNFSQNFQLMVLLQAYQPQKVNTDFYKDIAKKAHEDLQTYFKSGKWQSSWRQEEYDEKVGTNYQACYADLKCLLDIIPYWRDFEENMNVYIPCKMAQKYNKAVYLDTAGGGHGSNSTLVSDCDLYDQYKFDPELTQYVDMLFDESLAESDGSIRFLYYAKTTYQFLTSQYSPDFNLEEQERWDLFPYSEWSVDSYYNFKKFNSVLDYGIGYKKALEKLTDYYVQVFGVNREKAFNTALNALMIPSLDSSERITSKNLNYMLLTGAKWEEIENTHKDIKDYQKLLELSIAFPENLEKIIALGKTEDNFNIDYANEFGKTPLMLAAQYGYLDSVKILLKNGANINRQTNDAECFSSNKSLCITHGKRSALMYAAQEGQYEIVKYLLTQGAYINLNDSQGKMAYDYMLGTALEDYDPHKMMTINGGAAQPYSTEDKRSAFTAEQIEELKPLLKVKRLIE